MLIVSSVKLVITYSILACECVGRRDHCTSALESNHRPNHCTCDKLMGVWWFESAARWKYKGEEKGPVLI